MISEKELENIQAVAKRLVNADSARQDNMKEFDKLIRAAKLMNEKKLKTLLDFLIYAYIPESKHAKLIDALKKRRVIE